MTEKVTKYPKLWVDMMMSEELNLAQDNSRPFSHALVTFIAFLLAGSIPLAGPIAGYFSETILANGFTISVGLTVVALLLVGIVRARITFETWWRSMLELLFLGGLAASVAYGIGYGLKALIGYSI